MLGTVLLMVWAVAIIVYARNKNYGEATLALVAGLLTAYSVAWNKPRFIAFVMIWASFSFVALLVSSLRLAGNADGIYKEAALAMSDEDMDFASAEKKLKEVGEGQRSLALGPIERAEALRVFVVRRVPLSIMGAGLKAVAMLNVITDIDSNSVARFVADVYRIFGATTAEQGEIILNILLKTIRMSAVPTADFIVAFEHSRRLVLSRSVDAATYFANLQIALDAGVPPANMSDYLSSQIPSVG
jgi:hypothetical protein